MKLKCIGGEFDGQIKYIEDYYKIGNTIRFARPQEFKLDTSSFEVDLRAYRENRTPDYVTVKYSFYTIDCFHFSKDDVYKFLRPSDWTNKQAIQYQFEK